MKQILSLLLLLMLLPCGVARAASADDLAAASVDFKKGRLGADALIALCTEAIQDAENAPRVKSLAHLLRGQGRLAKKEYFLAADDARTSLRLDPAQSGGHILLSKVAEANKRYEEAIAELYKAAKLTDNALEKNKLHQQAEKVRAKAAKGNSFSLEDL